MTFDLDAIKHFRLPTVEEEFAASDIVRLQSALREILARTEDDLSPELRLTLIKNAAEKALNQ